jgi:acetyl esterase
MQAAAEPHPDVQEVLAQLEEFDVTPLRQHGPEGARELFANMRPDVDGPAVGDVEDRTVPGFQDGPEVPVRIYTPEADGPYPTMVYYHGGGFVIGDVETHDIVCRYLTNELGAVVVSVDYRLAPEHPFPAAVEDAFAATQWAAANEEALDSTGDLVVGGDSAGGNLAAAVSLMARDFAEYDDVDAPDVDYQVLVYPVVSRSDDWESMEQFGQGYFLDERDMEWFHDSYRPNPVHDANPYCNPLEASDLSGLPPATVLTAGFDPLRDQGGAYAEALEAAGTEVTYRNYDDMIHGFFSMQEGLAALDTAAEALDAVSDDVHAALD